MSDTVISVAPSRNGRPGNLTIENAKFFGRPNFAGEMNQFKDSRPQFTVVIPNENADELRNLGWNVKTLMPKPDMEDQEPLSILRIMVDLKPGEQHEGPRVMVIQGDQREMLTAETAGILDRSRVLQLDVECRGWEYDREAAPGALSARAVAVVAVLEDNMLARKYGFI